MRSRVAPFAGLLALLVLVPGGPGVPGAGRADAPAPVVGSRILGIADQHGSTFSDPLLTDLGIRHARVLFPWDGQRYAYQRRETAAWMRAVRAAGVQPLVTFGPSRRKTGRLPSVADYKRLTRAFRRRYPDVRHYAPWNEPNVSLRKQGNDPARIAAFYRTLRAGCERCTVLGVEVVDNSTMDDWLRAYLREFPPGRKPMLWGLHNYVDANALPLTSWGTRTMLRLVPGRIWVTETGAIHRRRKPTLGGPPDRRTKIRVRPRLSRQISERVFRLADLSPRITRVYIYHWRSGRRSSWDSALLTQAGTPRPSYDVFRREAHGPAPVG